MADEPHEVVKLLVARMESHPEEFERGLNHRWYDIMHEITEFGNEADKAAMNAKLRDIRLREAHEDALEELLNGPENRRRMQEEAEYEKQMLVKQAMAQQQSLQQQAAQKYAQTRGSFGAPIKGASTAGTWLEDTYNTTKPLTTRAPTTSDMESNGIMNALRNILK